MLQRANNYSISNFKLPANSLARLALSVRESSSGVAGIGQSLSRSPWILVAAHLQGCHPTLHPHLQNRTIIGKVQMCRHQVMVHLLEAIPAELR